MTNYSVTPLKGTFINDIEGNEIEVTDPIAALKQCFDCVLLHEQAKAAYKKNKKVFYCEDAHKNWQHKLKQMEYMKMHHPHLFETN